MEDPGSSPTALVSRPRKTKMPRCCLPGCKATNTSTHYFPKDLKRCGEWVKFVQTYKPDFTLSPWSIICGAHFEMNCYTHNFELEERMGCQRMRRNLTEDAIPTLYTPPTESPKPEIKPNVISINLKDASIVGNGEKIAIPAIRKIAPKKRSPKKSTQQNIVLKGKVLGPFTQSQPQLLLLPPGTSLAQMLPGTTSTPPKLALAQFKLPASTSSNLNGQLPQKLIIKPSTATQPPGKKNLPVPKEIIVKKKVVPRQNIIPVPFKEGVEYPEKKTTFTLKQVKVMTPYELVRSFSSRVKISDSDNYALRCRMGSNCPFVISCPSEYDCRSVMNLHLRKHVDWWIIGTAGNPFISSQLTFQGTLPVEAEEKPALEAKDGPVTPKDANKEQPVPCISESKEKQPERNEILQSAFRKLCETIASEMNQIKAEKERIEALMEDEEKHSKEGQEKEKTDLTSCLSPRKYLLPANKLKMLKEHEKADKGVNAVLPPLERFTNPPLILARSRRTNAADEPGMPVITAVRGSVKQPELDDRVSKNNSTLGSMRQKLDVSIQRPSALGFANQMIAKAKAAFDKISNTDDKANKKDDKALESNLREDDKTASPNPPVESGTMAESVETYTVPKLSELANEVLQNSSDAQRSNSQELEVDSDEEFLSSKNNEPDLINLEEPALDNLKLLDNTDDGNVAVPGLDDSRTVEQNERESDLEIVDVHTVMPCSQEKESFLRMLRLQRISPIKVTRVGVGGNSVGTKPLFRTRQQKKAAVLEKFYKKKHAAMAPKRVEVKLTAVKMEPPDEMSGNMFGDQDNDKDSQLEETREDVQPDPVRSSARSAPKSLFSRLKERMKSGPYRNSLHDAKRYQLRRAELLKKRARDQTLLNIKREYTQETMDYDQGEDWQGENHADLEESENHGIMVVGTSRVMKMPAERMLEVYKEDQKLLRDLEEDEAERKMEMQIRLLRRRRERLVEERIRREEEDRRLEEVRRNSLPVNELLPPDRMVLKRRHITIPSRLWNKSSERKPRNISCRQIVVDGKTITIKQEKVSESDASDVESFDEGCSSGEDADQPESKKSRLSESLERRGKSTTKRGNSSGSKRDDDFDSTDSEAGKDAEGSDDELDEEELELDFDVEDMSLPENVENKRSHRSRQKKMPPSDELGVSNVEQDKDWSSEETNKVSSVPAKLDNCDPPRRANYADPTVLSEAELKTRERALQYLRRLKILERERNQMFEAGEILPERDSKLLICKICNRNFTGLGSLYYHYRSHAGVKPFKCDICNKSFTRLHSLNYHIMIHADKTRFQCRYCGKGFRHPSHYKEHLNKHTGEEPFKCRECSRRFKTSNSLRRHLRNAHGLRMTVRIGDHMPTIAELEKEQASQPLPPTPSSPLLEALDCLPSSPLMRSLSPPLPESPPNPPKKETVVKPAEPVKALRLTLFPKNGLSRVCFADGEARTAK